MLARDHMALAPIMILNIVRDAKHFIDEVAAAFVKAHKHHMEQFREMYKRGMFMPTCTIEYKVKSITCMCICTGRYSYGPLQQKTDTVSTLFFLNGL